MAVTPTGTSTTTGTTASKSNQDMASAMSGLSLDDFFKLMIAEMQNQDPLNPLENHQLLQQISQIQEYGATQKLTQTLDAVLLGQNLSNATGLIGRFIYALSDDGDDVLGVVNRVSVANNDVRVHVGNQEVKLNNIREVMTAF
jgi:flagellar basal-body rod modification protein FlgD